jgi:PAS domain S-box-containing protein
MFGTVHAVPGGADYSTLFELLPIGAYRSSREGRQLRANAALVRLNGYASEAEMLSAVNDIAAEWYVDPAQRAEFRRRIESKGVVTDFVSEIYRHKTRERIWIRENAHVVRDPAGDVMFYEGTVEDITAERHTHLALAASERRFRALTEKAQVLTLVCDRKAIITYASPAALALLGREPAQMVGRSPLDWVHPDDVDAADAEFAAILDHRNTGIESVYRFQHAEGSWRHLAALANNFVDDSAVAGVAVHLRDITERVLAEQAQAQLLGQLREAQKMESIGTLAGGIAHDFNNILAAILGNLAVVGDELGEAHPARTVLEQIRKSSLRARDLVQQILAFSRRQPQQLLNLRLRPVVEDSLALLRATLPAHVALDVQLPDTPIVVHADATQVQQVLLNLCTNAWHALQGGPGRIGVGLTAVELRGAVTLPTGTLGPGNYAKLWVSDTGCGIDAAARERIFEPFFTTKPVGQGTGLGLSVVHGIVRSHRGGISFASAPGQGSTFEIFLPTSTQRPDDVAEAACQPAPDGRGRHVLYVDDDEVMTLMMERLLQRIGYRVTLAHDGRAAVATLDRQAFDLVLTDFNMPGYSGLDVARAVAARQPALPVVLSSGYVSDDLRAQAAAAGVRALINKQRIVEDVGATLERVLSPSSIG